MKLKKPRKKRVYKSRPGRIPTIVLHKDKIEKETIYNQMELSNLFNVSKAQISAIAKKYKWPYKLDFSLTPAGHQRIMMLYKGEDILNSVKNLYPQFFGMHIPSMRSPINKEPNLLITSTGLDRLCQELSEIKLEISSLRSQIKESTSHSIPQ